MPTTGSQYDLGPNVLDRFTTLDYVIFSTMLLLSAIIGVFYAFRGVPKSHRDFLMADRNLDFWPVAFSLAASFMSAFTVLGTPAEVYRFGSVFILFAFSYAIAVVISAEVFLPVFYRLRLTSVYEYLELRYNKYMRILGTMTFIILTMLYTSIVIYSPSLALNKGTVNICIHTRTKCSNTGKAALPRATILLSLELSKQNIISKNNYCRKILNVSNSHLQTYF